MTASKVKCYLYLSGMVSWSGLDVPQNHHSLAPFTLLTLQELNGHTFVLSLLRMNTIGGSALSLEKFPNASRGTTTTCGDHRHALNDYKAIHSAGFKHSLRHTFVKLVKSAFFITPVLSLYSDFLVDKN